jgi:hypothetical protein
MPKSIISGIAILLLFLPLFSPGSAMAFTVQEGPTAIQQGAPSNAPTKPAPAIKQGAPSKAPAKSAPATTSSRLSPSAQREVVNIVVDKIEEGAIYANDGAKFEISSSTRVVDNSHPNAGRRTAELFFENGTLVSVSLK